MESIKIGNYNNCDVYFDVKNTPNKHVLMVGTSGSGKSVSMQSFASKVLEQGGTVLAINSHGVLDKDQIHPSILPIINTYCNEIDCSNDGIKFPLFDGVGFEDGYIESDVDIIGSITDIISRAMKFGVKQKSVLRQAIEITYFDGSYKVEGFKAVGRNLKAMNNKMSDELYERMYNLFSRNIFIEGDSLIKKNKISIVQLNKLDLDSQEIVTEIILSLIWRLANAGAFKKSEIYLFLDECQNLDTSAKSPLALFLSEGRKMGVNLILGTQMVLQGTTNTVQQRLTQAGLILCFKPASNRIAVTAKMIEPGNDIKWVGTLATLGVGEFIAMGTLEVNGHSVNYPLKVDGYIRAEDAEFIGMQENKVRKAIDIPIVVKKGGD